MQNPIQLQSNNHFRPITIHLRIFATRDYHYALEYLNGAFVKTNNRINHFHTSIQRNTADRELITLNNERLNAQQEIDTNQLKSMPDFWKRIPVPRNL